MVQLSVSAACAYVRKTLDELTSVEDLGMLVSPDALDIHKIVEDSIVEAAVRVHRLAPSSMIDGDVAVDGTDYELEIPEGSDVATLTMKVDTLRIASVKACDSDYVVTDTVPEDSPEGRKQLNSFVRGVPDDPTLVLCKVWDGDNLPVFKYYSFSSDTAEKTMDVTYVPYPVIEETIIKICPKLEFAVLNEIVAMVLDAFSEHERAALFREKSRAYFENK